MIKSIEKYNFDRTLKYFDSYANNLDGSRILISGATGFIGSWISEMLSQITREFGLKFEVILLTRNSLKLGKTMGSEINKNFSIEEINIAREYRPLGEVSHIIHAATPTYPTSEVDVNVEEVSLNGAINLLKSINLKNHKPVFIHLSSGAVYGHNSILQGSLDLRTELNYPSNILNFANKYSVAKIKTESFVDELTNRGIIYGCNPRLFAFFGPLLALDEKYAIGNFMRFAINSENIRLKTRGESVRSYLHVSHCASQLIYLLSQPILGASHIGSSFARPLKWWANFIGNLFDLGPIIMGEEMENPSFYAPKTDIRFPSLDLDESERIIEFKYWFDWLKDRKQTH